jgi:predicted AlkP superfamily phosphohydrolase/phosphomutase
VIGGEKQACIAGRGTSIAAVAARALVVGLDCAAPQWVFDRWLDDLPNLRSLTERGAYGILRSCEPPITVPAWSVMTSSRSPGALGFYGFRNRRDHSYDALSFADSRAVREPRVWDILSGRGRPVIVVGVPQTYPVNEVNGAMISCFLTPDTTKSQFTYPAELKAEIEGLVGHYMVDVENLRTEEKDALLAQIEEMTEKRFQVAEHLLETRPWDLFFMVEMGPDRIHHGFWRFFDHEHRLYEPGNPYEARVLDYYRRLDDKVGRLLRFADEDTAVLVVSDHGAKRMDGGICVNEWLRREGYLVLKQEPAAPTPLKPEMIDWERTTAWGEGGYYCRLFLNVEGREPQGTVAQERYEEVRDDLKSKLESLPDADGRPLGTVAHRPEDIYAEARGVVPDLLVYFGNLYWRSIGQVGTGSVHVFENDTGPDDANHAHEGLYVLVADGVPAGPGPDRDILDVAPTLLTVLGERVPAEMEGSSLVRAASPAARG